MSKHALDLAFNIYCIDIDYIRPRLACSYLMLHEGKAAFIDCGTSLSVPRLVSTLNDLGLSNDDVDYIIPTHIHLDHAGGAGKLMQIMPNAQLIVHPLGARHLIDPQRLIESAQQVYGSEQFAKLYGDIIPIDEQRVCTVRDADVINFNGRTLFFADTPGHARHHFCIYDELSQGWFTGDTFGLSYPDIIIPEGHYLLPTTTPVQFDPDAWFKSIKKLLLKKPQRMYLTHFGMIDNVSFLAEKLQHDIQHYSQIALSIPACETRTEQLKSKLIKYTLDDLLTLNCKQTDSELVELLKTDLELNAQGLDIWLKRQEKQR